MLRCQAGIRPTAVTYATMIDGLASSGDTLKSMQLFWEARSTGLVLYSLITILHASCSRAVARACACAAQRQTGRCRVGDVTMQH